MLAIAAERQPKKIGLAGLAPQPFIGNIAQLIRLQVQHGERLLFSGGVRAVTTVQEDGKAAIRRNRGGGGGIVGWAGIAGGLAKEFAVGDLGADWRRIFLRGEDSGRKRESCRESDLSKSQRNWHRRIILDSE